MTLQIPKISFEFFPPKTLQASFNLWESLKILTLLNPDFVSVTYGAGGSTRKLTQEMTETIRHKYQLDFAAVIYNRLDRLDALKLSVKQRG